MSKSTRKKIKTILKEVEKLISTQEYDFAKHKIERVEKLLIESDTEDIDNLLSFHAILYDFRLAICEQIGSKEEVLSIHQELVRFFSQYETWCFHVGYEDVRNTVRIAYKSLAMNALEKDSTQSGILEAVQFIDECFEIETNYDNDFSSYYEARAIIYHKAKSIKPQYETEYYKTLEKIREGKISIQNEQVKEDLGEDSSHQLHFGSLNETFEEAVERYKKCFYDGEPFNFKAPYTPDEVTKAEIKAEVTFPSSLKDFYLNIAGGGGNEYNLDGLEIYAPNKICGLMDYIRCDWYHEPKDASIDDIRGWYNSWYTEELTDSDMEYMQFVNENYKVIGLYYNDGEHIYVLVYGQNGKMGAFDFIQDTWSGDLEILIDHNFPILKYESFDELISRLFNVVIHINHLEDESWEGPISKLMERNT